MLSRTAKTVKTAKAVMKATPLKLSMPNMTGRPGHWTMEMN